MFPLLFESIPFGILYLSIQFELKIFVHKTDVFLAKMNIVRAFLMYKLLGQLI